MNTVFKIDFVDSSVKQELEKSDQLRVVFDKLSVCDVTMTPVLTYGDAVISGLVESYGLKGKWDITITGKGDLSEHWKGFSAHYHAAVDVRGDDSLFVKIDGSALTASAVIDALATLSEAVDIDNCASDMRIVSSSGVPMEIYYRPPLGFYDDFALADMDTDTLAQLERRLIE